MRPLSQSKLEMSEADFRAITDIAYKEAGLVFLPEKASLVCSRINRRLRKLRLNSFAEYTAFVTSDQGRDERRAMISSLTTNISNFFRESHHFDILRKEALPALLDRARAGGRVRLWSAGCSTGQEAYSMAMTLLDAAPDAASLDIKILATDIDPYVIATAKQGFYDSRAVGGISSTLMEKFLSPAKNGPRDGYLISTEIQNLISFRELNLLRPWPISRSFDVIFCRNVVIYFDEKTQLSLWPRFESVTAPEGWLFVGHSERLSDKLETGFETVGPTTYRRGDPAITNESVE